MFFLNHGNLLILITKVIIEKPVALIRLVVIQFVKVYFNFNI